MAVEYDVMISPNGLKTYNLPEGVLEKIREYARLHYSLTQIALMIGIPVTDFRRMAAIPDTPIYNAYHSGKLESQTVYRTKVVELAGNGEEWAVEMLERWRAEQRKEELGFEG